MEILRYYYNVSSLYPHVLFHTPSSKIMETLLMSWAINISLYISVEGIKYGQTVTIDH